MYRAVSIASLAILLLLGCKKRDTPCEKNCKKLASCYAKHDRSLRNRAGAVKNCARLCSAEGGKKYREALESLEMTGCQGFMDSNRRLARMLIRGGRFVKGGRRGRGRPATSLPASQHPFPAIHGVPPADPKARRNWRSPVLEKVDQIVITRGKLRIELKRVAEGKTAVDAGDWNMLKPEQGKADRIAVRNLLNKLGRMVFRGKEDIDPKDFAKHQLDEATGTNCQLMGKGKLLADMIVGTHAGKGSGGKSKGSGGLQTLVRKKGSDVVFTVAGSLAYLFRRAPSGWRDATVVEIKREDLARLSLTLTSGQLVLKRDPNEKNPRLKYTNWVVERAEPPLGTLDQSEVTRLVAVLTRLRAVSFVATPKPGETGLEKPRATVVMADRNGKTVTLLIGKKQPKRRATYAQLKGDSRVFLARQPLDELPERAVTDFRDKTLIAAEVGQITAITVEHKGARSVFRKQGRIWKMQEPINVTLDRAKLMSAVRLLEGRFSAHRFAAGVTPAKAGLLRPEGRIIIEISEPKQPKRRAEVLVGKTAERGNIYVQVKGETQVFLMRSWMLKRVYRGPKEWSAGAAGTRKKGLKKIKGVGLRGGAMAPSVGIMKP